MEMLSEAFGSALAGAKNRIGGFERRHLGDPGGGASSIGRHFGRSLVAVLVCAGVVLGAFTGSRYLTKVKAQWLRALFVAVLLWVAFQMLRKGVSS